MKVCVCIATYRRPTGLAALLAALAEQQFAGAPPETGIIVVDNDPSGSAEATCRAAGVRYAIEPEPGIPAARNACVALVPDDADLVAFIDDDEIPTPSWLERLLHTQRDYDADVVAGPVIADLDDAPPWIVEGRFFELPRHATGEAIRDAGTGNVLVRAAALRAVPGPFDVSLATTGGTDTLLFRQLGLRGHRMVWCDDAIVHERVPAERLTVEWLLRRARRIGTMQVIVMRRAEPSAVGIVRQILESLLRVTRGIVLWISGLVAGRSRRMVGRWELQRGIGIVRGLLGGRSREYARSDA